MLSSNIWYSSVVYLYLRWDKGSCLETLCLEGLWVYLCLEGLWVYLSPLEMGQALFPPDRFPLTGQVTHRRLSVFCQEVTTVSVSSNNWGKEFRSFSIDWSKSFSVTIFSLMLLIPRELLFYQPPVLHHGERLVVKSDIDMVSNDFISRYLTNQTVFLFPPLTITSRGTWCLWFFSLYRGFSI